MLPWVSKCAPIFKMKSSKRKVCVHYSGWILNLQGHERKFLLVASILAVGLKTVKKRSSPLTCVAFCLEYIPGGVIISVRYSIKLMRNNRNYMLILFQNTSWPSLIQLINQHTAFLFGVEPWVLHNSGLNEHLFTPEMDVSRALMGWETKKCGLNPILPWRILSSSEVRKPEKRHWLFVNSFLYDTVIIYQSNPATSKKTASESIHSLSAHEEESSILSVYRCFQIVKAAISRTKPRGPRLWGDAFCPYTLAHSWLPNFLFHCHLAGHVPVTPREHLPESATSQREPRAGPPLELLQSNIHRGAPPEKRMSHGVAAGKGFRAVFAIRASLKGPRLFLFPLLRPSDQMDEAGPATLPPPPAPCPCSRLLLSPRRLWTLLYLFQNNQPTNPQPQSYRAPGRVIWQSETDGLRRRGGRREEEKEIRLCARDPAVHWNTVSNTDAGTRCSNKPLCL